MDKKYEFIQTFDKNCKIYENYIEFIDPNDIKKYFTKI